MPVALLNLLLKVVKSKPFIYVCSSLVALVVIYKVGNHYLLQYREKVTTAAIEKIVKENEEKEKEIQRLKIDATTAMATAVEQKSRAEEYKAKSDENFSRYQTAKKRLEDLEQPSSQLFTSLQDCKEAYSLLATSAQETTAEADATIAKKDAAYVQLDLSLKSCFTASAAFQQALSKSEERAAGFRQGLELQEGLTATIKAERDKETRRKWWFLAGGIITGFVVKKQIGK